MAKYALLFSGGVNPSGNHSRYANDIAFTYRVLTETLNYTEENIRVLFADGSALPYMQTLPANKSNFIQLINSFSKIVKGDDLFLFLASNHGSKDASICTWGENERLWLEQNEVERTLNGIRCIKIIIMGQCFGGNYTASAAISNSVVISANEPNTESYARAKKVNGKWCDAGYDEFIYHFMAYYYGSYPSGEALLASNSCKLIQNGFEYAKQHDSYSAQAKHPFGLIETPCLQNNLIDKNLIKTITL